MLHVVSLNVSGGRVLTTSILPPSLMSSLSISGDSGNIDDGGPDGAMASAGQVLEEARGGAITPIGSPGSPGGGKTIVITAEVTAEAEAAAARSPLEDDEDGGVDTDDDDAKTAEAEAHADPG